MPPMSNAKILTAVQFLKDTVSENERNANRKQELTDNIDKALSYFRCRQ